MNVERIVNLADVLDRCLARLEESVSEPAVDNRDLAGIVKHFELAYEQTYKCLLELLLALNEEDSQRSAKVVFRRAFEFGWITDEPSFLAMIVDRNSTTHTYDEEFARSIVQRINDIYLPQLRNLHLRILEEIQSLGA